MALLTLIISHFYCRIYYQYTLWSTRKGVQRTTLYKDNKSCLVGQRRFYINPTDKIYEGNKIK